MDKVIAKQGTRRRLALSLCKDRLASTMKMAERLSHA